MLFANIPFLFSSISIACWIVVFSPQIIENFRRGSADGLSLLFLIIWLSGDVFNILGAVLQGVLPTMLILAVYYTLADLVLLAQCLYYKGFTLKDELSPESVNEGTTSGDANEQTALLAAPETSSWPATQHSAPGSGHHAVASSFLHPSVDGTHLSPATPFVEPTPKVTRRRISTLQSILFNLAAVVIVCAAGIVGWWASVHSSKDYGVHNPKKHGDNNAPPKMDVLGQVFGYLCAVLYLGSRLPQIMLNFRRKSTEGVSLLFFLFACIGNSTYVLSILAYSPVCGKENKRCRPGETAELYWWYVLVNLSWLLGSFGTLLLDMLIFAQFFLYRKNDEDDEEVR